MNVSPPEHNRISPTAKMVAYWRQFSDVPFASDVAEMIQAREISQSMMPGASFSMESMQILAPMIEARYKSLVSAIERNGIKQVLELASGVSLRGLAMTSDPEMTYVETDLPEMSEEKKYLVQNLRDKHGIPERPKLFYHAANVLNLRELEEAASHFSVRRPVAIIHEGLMQYLSLEEKEIAARNIHALLSRFQGIWVTPDFATKIDLDENWNQNDDLKRMTTAVTAATQRNFYDHAFEDDDHILNFFSRLGFEVSVSPQVDGTYRLSALDQLKVPPEVLSRLRGHLKLWTLRI